MRLDTVDFNAPRLSLEPGHRARSALIREFDAAWNDDRGLQVAIEIEHTQRGWFRGRFDGMRAAG